MNKLLNLIKQYLNNDMLSEEFVLDFEELFLDIEDKVYSDNIELYNLLDDIRMACAYYEDNEEIRKQCDSYMSLKQFKEKIKKTYEAIVNL